MSRMRTALNRRRFISGTASAAFLAAIASPMPTFAARSNLAFRPLAGPRSRVLFINDLSGDVDRLFATVHQVLSPSTKLRGIVGTRSG